MTFDPTPHETILDPHRTTHVGLWREEASAPHARYYRWDLPPLPRRYLAAMEDGETPAGPGLTADRLTDLLEPDHLPVETGIARSDHGELCVAVWTPWPGTTPAMIDWWFGWHTTETDRYKLWHPQAHVYAQARFDLADVPDLSHRQRYVGNTSWVDEYVGPLLTRLAISFHDPADLGIPYDALEASGHGTAVCAEVNDSDTGQHLAHLVHAVRRTDYGSEMRSRFFFPAGTPDLLGPPMLEHCATEMLNLAEFLPRLFVDVTGYGEHS
ncbi:MAG: hypothetical protein IPM45_00170 [Acidimicrobiales bacterium]|nr:hypothetical protein [Acidimicrobiales bacterium]